MSRRDVLQKMYEELPFQVGDTVAIDNNFSFNPCYKALTIGVVEAIHIMRGHEIGYNPKTETEPKSVRGQVRYDIAGHNEVRIPAEKLILIERRYR